MNERVLESKKRLADPISIVAHQLKNPLSAIKAFLETLLAGDMGELNARQSDYVQHSLKNLDAIVKTINELLEVSQIEGRSYRLKSSLIDLVGITKEVIQSFDPWIKALNREITLRIEGEMPEVFADAGKIRQVVENIISNAVKYGAVGRGHIRVTIERENGMVRFSCADDGIGVPEGDEGKIFTKYYRSEEAVEHDPSGTGLGLYINKAIIELSGGSIEFENRPGRGMIFSFLLPAASRI